MMRCLGVLLAILLLPMAANAQICRGLADIPTGQGGGTFDFSNDGFGLNGLYAGGTDAYFAEVEAGWAWPEGTGGNLFGSQVFVAAQIPAADRRVMVCPGGFGTFRHSGNVDGFGTDLLGFGFGGGVAFGAIAAETANLQVIPTVGVMIGRDRDRFENPLAELILTDTTGTVEVGAGLIVNRRISIKPSVWIPILHDFTEPDPGFRLTFTFR